MTGASPPHPLASLVDRRRAGVPRGSHRALALCEELGSPHLAVPAVHVAGTNGKTTVVRMIASLLEALGVRAGDTTSPHLHDLGERIRVEGRPAPHAVVAAAAADLPAALERVEQRTGEAPTFFDAVTAVALRVFADRRCRLAVVEAGIGGTGDATAVVQGAVSVLTPIGLDHPELGTTHAEVAANKAGIVRPGGTVISAAQPPAAMRVIERVAATRGARLFVAGDALGTAGGERRRVRGGQVVELTGLDGRSTSVFLPLHGGPHAENAALALGAVQAALGTCDLDPARVREGFARVRVPGRMEIVRSEGAPAVVLDGAHDPVSSAALAETLRERFPDVPIALVVGTSGGRDPLPVLAPLLDTVGPRIAGITATAARAPGASPPQAVAARLRAGEWEVAARVGADEALAAACGQVPPAAGVVVVTGSLYLVGEVRGLAAHLATVGA